LKDALEFFKGDTFRLVVVYLIPGALVTWPYYRLAGFLSPDVIELLPHDENGRVAALVAISILTGFLLENIGSRIEYCWDSDAVNERWRAFIGRSCPDDIPAVLYLRQVEFRMKLELSLGVALGLDIIAMTIMTANGLIGVYTGSIVILGALPIAIWSFYEAYTSHGLLDDLRAVICEPRENA
jgi:hypothetical protein